MLSVCVNAVSVMASVLMLRVAVVYLWAGVNCHRPIHRRHRQALRLLDRSSTLEFRRELRLLDRSSMLEFSAVDLRLLQSKRDIR